MISLMSVVDSPDALGIFNVTVTWNMEHATTATMAATMVLMRYSAMIRRKWFLYVDVDLDREFRTRMKTKNGAIALRAPMNMSPMADINSILGITNARMIPMTNPMTILRMRLTEFHLS